MSYYILKDLETGVSIQLYLHQMRYLGSGANSDAFYINLPSDQVLGKLEQELVTLGNRLQELKHKEASIKAPRTQEGWNRKPSVQAFTPDQQVQLDQLKADSKDLEKSQNAVNSQIKEIKNNAHPFYGERVLRVNRYKCRENIDVIIEEDEEQLQSRITQLQSEIRVGVNNRNSRAERLTDHLDNTNKHDKLAFQFDLLSNCLFICPRNQRSFAAQICFYSSFGDLDFLLEKYLADENYQRSMDVIYWAYLRQQDLLYQVHLLGFVHGDFKPANVLVNKNFSLRLVDYDFTYPASAQAKLGGTPGFVYPYLAPSDYISKGQSQVVKYLYEFDTFALGASLLRLLVGRKAGTLFDADPWRFHFIRGSSTLQPYELKVLNFSSASKSYGSVINQKLEKLSCNNPKFSSKEFTSLTNLCLFLTMPKLPHGYQASAESPVFHWGGRSSLRALKDPILTFEYVERKIWPSRRFDYWSRCWLQDPPQKELRLESQPEISDISEWLNSLRDSYIEKPPVTELYRLLFLERFEKYIGAKVYAYWVEEIQYHIDQLHEAIDGAYKAFGRKYFDAPVQAPNGSSMGVSCMLKSSYNLPAEGERKTVYHKMYNKLVLAAQDICELIGTMPSGKKHQFPGFNYGRGNQFLADLNIKVTSLAVSGESNHHIKSDQVSFSGLNLKENSNELRLEFSRLYGHPDTYDIRKARCLEDPHTDFSGDLDDWLEPGGILNKLKPLHEAIANEIKLARLAASGNSAVNKTTERALQHVLDRVSEKEGKNLIGNLSTLLIEEDIPDLEYYSVSMLASLSEIARLLRPTGADLEVDVSVNEPRIQNYMQKLEKYPLGEYAAKRFAAETKKQLCNMQSLTLCRMVEAVKPGLHETFFQHVKVDVRFKWNDPTQADSVQKFKRMIGNYRARLTRMPKRTTANPK